MTRGRQRANGEGSIFPYRNGYAAYAWVTTPDGARRRKWVYGKDRKSTRLNSSHVKISYAVFCLKKKKKN